MTGQDVKIDRFLSRIQSNLETTLDFLEAEDIYKARSYLSGTIDGIADCRTELLNQKRRRRK